ncbi:class I adenylate-forming enzyme family protein [Kutzneria sp. CA-103260]|uniref:class I adenylate-forming enzyme family protein n=1 Tax=Kutzneria sp. CA-103260 TaxID=2802641 RepID=UPI001BAC22E1|nr:class I adenylate-forming enzyme family protein [Kutzneria sp. CA-103260]QUQ68330.1 AMP-dependent acyl-CoA synthetase/AMP-acid ligases II [Kutzneria sp. CA-103260]
MQHNDSVPVLDARRVADFLDNVVDADGAASRQSLDDVTADLARLGLPAGTAVVLALSNSVQMVRTYLSALLLGLVPLAVAPATPSARIRELASRLGAGAVIAGRLAPERYGATQIHVVGAAEAVLLSGATSYESGQVLIPTSGTSGMFSACLHRVDSLLRNAHRHAGAVGLTSDDVVLVNLPLYYSYAMVAQVLAAYVQGAALVVSGPPFTPSAYRKALGQHGITQSSITPTIARQLLARPEGLPNGLRALAVGGDQLTADQVAALLAARPGGELYITYGLTEAGPRVSTLAAHAEPARRHASVGRPLPGVRAYLRGPDDELLVESDTVLVRKIGGSTANRVLVADRTVATGDVFHIDDDGYLFFRGRLSDFVMVRGEKVSLTGIKQAAQAIPGVLRCVPIVRAEDDGAVLDVEISVADPGPDTERAVRRALNSVLLPGERPSRILIAAESGAFQK